MKKNLIHVIYPAESVYSYVMETDDSVENILEYVFSGWNHGSGVESKIFINSKKRSLSVNDIVLLNGKYHQCLPCGWKEVTAEFVNDLEDEVEKNPNMVHGPWFALQDVMRQRSKCELVTV